MVLNSFFFFFQTPTADTQSSVCPCSFTSVTCDSTEPIASYPSPQHSPTAPCSRQEPAVLMDFLSMYLHSSHPCPHAHTHEHTPSLDTQKFSCNALQPPAMCRTTFLAA